MIDIRLPIGMLFSIVGALLLFYGVVTLHRADIYQKSFGINVNLWAGGLMLLFGIVMLSITKGTRKTK